jgi:hypothetical protein
MSYILFIDESGHDGKLSPHEVLAGVSVEDRELWNLISSIQQIEIECFGRRYSAGASELKGKKILKTKVFRHATSRPEFDPEERRSLAKQALDHGESANSDHLAALGQAKIDFVRRTLILCSQHRCRAFASIVPREALRSLSKEHLRKDYSYLFQRFFDFLEDVSPESLGFVVFDEIEKSQSHLLINQMSKYFRETTDDGNSVGGSRRLHSGLGDSSWPDGTTSPSRACRIRSTRHESPSSIGSRNSRQPEFFDLELCGDRRFEITR